MSSTELSGSIAPQNIHATDRRPDAAASSIPSIAVHIPANDETAESVDGIGLVAECGVLMFQVTCALIQGVIGLIPLMLMWSVLCTLAALVFLPLDLVLALVHAAKQARQQGALKTIVNLALVIVVVALWPVVVCTFHLMAAFVLAFSEPFERQVVGGMRSITIGGLESMFAFAHQRMVDFVKLCWVKRIDFWMKWKMMLRAVTAFLVFFTHGALTLAVTTLLAAVKLPIFALIGATAPCAWLLDLRTSWSTYSKPTRVALCTALLPLLLPLTLALCALCCVCFVGAYVMGTCFLLMMSVLGGGLYVADATFKKMSWRTTRLAMAYVITEFDKDTSELLSHIMVDEARIGRLLPSLPDPYPEFTAEEPGTGLQGQTNILDESCEAFLQSCTSQAQDLITKQWLDPADFQSAEPFIFLGLPGHVLLSYLKASPYEALVLRPGLQLNLQQDLLGTSWVDPLRLDLLRAQVQVFETCVTEEDWRYLEAWVALCGDEARLEVLDVASPADGQRAAQLNRLASAINSMSINITRMGWFQAHFQKKVMDAILEAMPLSEAPQPFNIKRHASDSLRVGKADTEAEEDTSCSSPNANSGDTIINIPAVHGHSRLSCSPDTAALHSHSCVMCSPDTPAAAGRGAGGVDVGGVEIDRELSSMEAGWMAPSPAVLHTEDEQTADDLQLEAVVLVQTPLHSINLYVQDTAEQQQQHVQIAKQQDAHQERQEQQ